MQQQPGELRFAAPLRVAFIGSTRFGMVCLDAALELPEVELAGIVTNPARFSISYSPRPVTNILHADVASLGRARDIPVFIMTTKMTDPDLTRAIESWRPDVLLVAGWYHMVPAHLREIAPAIGFHASLLPDYSGGAPLVWAIINGEERTGLTLFVLGDGVDDGPIIAQHVEPIRADDTIATLYARIELAGAAMVREHLPRLVHGGVVPQPQDESRRRIFRQRRPEDGLIDWRRPRRAVHDFIRAQTKPYPGAFTVVEERRIHVWGSRLDAPTTRALEPGELALVGGRPIAGCLDGALEVVLDDDAIEELSRRGEPRRGDAHRPLR